MNERKTVYLRGKLDWAKVLPRQLTKNNFDDYNEWSFNVYPEDTKELPKEKLKRNDNGEYIQLRQKEFRADGKPNDPIRIVDAGGSPWDENTELGNGTVADVRVSVVDYGKGKKKGVYPVAIRVLEHVPYQASAFKPLTDDDKAKYSVSDKQFKKDFGLEDEDRLDDDFPL